MKQLTTCVFAAFSAPDGSLAMMKVSAMAIAGLWSAATSSALAQGAPASTEPPMQVHVVRSAEFGCEPSCLEWISAQGKIDSASVAQLRRVLSRLGGRKLPVLIDSGGGSVNDAFAMGRLVRAKDLDVVVTATVFTPCAATDAACLKAKLPGVVRGLPQGRLAKCASACAFILAGGTRRFVGERAFVGVHQISSYRTWILRTYRVTTRQVWGVPVQTQKQLVAERKIAEKTVQTKTPQSVYDKTKQYFGEMGVRETIMPLLESTPSASVHWLSRSELRLTRMATDWLDGEQLLTVAGKAADGPIAAPEVAGIPRQVAPSLPLPSSGPAAPDAPVLVSTPAAPPAPANLEREAPAVQAAPARKLLDEKAAGEPTVNVKRNAAQVSERVREDRAKRALVEDPNAMCWTYAGWIRECSNSNSTGKRAN